MRRGEINPTDVARGHWRYILTQFDVPESALTGRHVPCPSCGGEDRFRFDNKDGAGTYYCSNCGAGTGYTLLMKLQGWDFPTALAEVKALVKPDMMPDPAPEVISLESKRASLNRLWKSGDPGSQHVVSYLMGRGLSEETAKRAAQKMRFTAEAWHKEAGRYCPAMLAPVQRASGKPVSIHRTFVSLKEKKKKLMPPVGEMNGAGIWFGSPKDSRWIVGEGIETTLAAWQAEHYHGVAVAAISAHGMENLEIPGHVEDLVIVADNDASFTGMKAATSLAYRVARRKVPVDVTIACPQITGHDMLDALNEGDLDSVLFMCGGRK